MSAPLLVRSVAQGWLTMNREVPWEPGDQVKLLLGAHRAALGPYRVVAVDGCRLRTEPPLFYAGDGDVMEKVET